jgi:hypothetical protein
MKRLAILMLLLFALGASAQTIDNDDSCDIALLPAATLLVPYFEVDVDDPNGDTTLFTITNVSPKDQIAHVTLWTDRAFPVIGFNIYLTGYDVQSINLFDVIERGIIAPDAGTGTAVTKRGRFSDPNTALDLTACNRLPGALDNAYVNRMQTAFREGDVPPLGNVVPGCNDIGGVHENAVGYVTIDVVRACTQYVGNEPDYFRNEILWDNVLIGDYQQITRTNRFAEGGPMVHVRAVPEGGTSQERRNNPAQFDAGFPRTFYSRYQAAATPRLDGRQPLPTTFAARWINGGSASFQTFFKIWREGKTGAGATCAAHTAEKHLEVVEIAVFDEAENAFADVAQCRCNPPGVESEWELPPTSLTDVSDSAQYPLASNGAVAGWTYFNLADPDRGFAAQAWVISSMRAEGQFSIDMDASALANGCTPAMRRSEVREGTGVIGPP